MKSSNKQSVQKYDKKRWLVPMNEFVTTNDEGVTEYEYNEVIVESENAEDAIIKAKLAQIDEYDTSENVNSFTYNGITTWMDKNTRAYVRGGVEAMIASGEENYPLWLNDMCITLPCKQLIGMLNMLETYAVKCYDVTARHKANVGKLENTEDILTYDYKAGYPKRLAF